VRLLRVMGTAGIIFGLISPALSQDRSYSYCVADAQRLCPELPFGQCISFVMSKRRADASRVCVDYFQAGLASACDFPADCFDQMFIECPGYGASVPASETCWQTHPDVAACTKRHAGEVSRGMSVSRTATYRLAHTLVDIMALLEHAASDDERWSGLINDASFLIRIYRDDPEPLLRDGEANFLKAFAETKLWDSRVNPTPRKNVDNEAVLASLQSMISGLEKFTDDKTWPTMTPEEDQLLRQHLKLLLSESEPVHFAGLQVPEDHLRQWIAGHANAM